MLSSHSRILAEAINSKILTKNHPDSLNSHSDSPHSYPDSPHSHPDSPHSHPIPQIPTLIPRIPQFLHIPTPIPRIPTRIPRVPIIPLIPFPDSPFRLLQITVNVHTWYVILLHFYQISVPLFNL